MVPKETIHGTNDNHSAPDHRRRRRISTPKANASLKGTGEACHRSVRRNQKLGHRAQLKPKGAAWFFHLWRPSRSPGDLFSGLGKQKKRSSSRVCKDEALETKKTSKTSRKLSGGPPDSEKIHQLGWTFSEAIQQGFGSQNPKRCSCSHEIGASAVELNSTCKLFSLALGLRVDDATLATWSQRVVSTATAGSC